MRTRSAAVAVVALAGCTHGHHGVTAPPVARRISVAPRPVEAEASRSARLLPVTAGLEPSASGRDLGSFRATCYAERGRTASGVVAGPGSIAVDPAVIPLGTHLTIDGWGNGTADDTGGAIRGRRVDVWLPTVAACMAWGVRWANVEEAA